VQPTQFAVTPITTFLPESLSSVTTGLIFFNYTQLMLWDPPHKKMMAFPGSPANTP